MIKSIPGFIGEKRTIHNPMKVKYNYNYILPTGDVIPRNTKHEQFTTKNFGWWTWIDKHGETRLVRY